MDNNRPKRNVTITPEDQVLCRMCECGDFYQPIYIYKVASPIIGQRPIVTLQPNTAAMIVCAGCMTPLKPDTLSTKAELDKLVQFEPTPDADQKLAKVTRRARNEALRILQTVESACAELNVTPDFFANLMDVESAKLKLDSTDTKPQQEILL